MLLSAFVAPTQSWAQEYSWNQAWSAEQSATSSTLNTGNVVTASTQTVESQFEGPAAESRRTTAAVFDLSYYLVLGLGLAGLVLMRRHSQDL